MPSTTEAYSSLTRTLDHFLFPVPEDQFEAIVAWYLAALAPIGYEKLMEFPGVVGIGAKPRADLWIVGKKDVPAKSDFHLAFRAEDHDQVKAFHEAAVKAGGTSCGEPGIREMYHPNYYAAFVRDPMGNNIEVVDHIPH